MASRSPTKRLILCLLLVAMVSHVAIAAWSVAPNRTAGQTVGDLRAAGSKDAHHVIQDAAVRDIPGYNTNAAPGVQL